MLLTMLMTKKNASVWRLVAAGLLIAGSLIIIFYKKNQQAASDLLPVELHPLKIGDGWGYEVLVDNKVYIHQDCIPAIPSFRRFRSESEALLVGKLVVDKIKHGHKPVMTLQEIRDNHITY